ncbi:hypothetical protein ACF1CY_000754 [Providencia rettgeri]
MKPTKIAADELIEGIGATASKIAVARIPGELEQKMTQEAENRDLLNQLLGQVQMADAFTKLTATVAVSKMAYVKENKLYQYLNGVNDRDGRGLKGTWEEFCKLLGTSAPKANEDINNLQTFGEEALESMSRMGIGYRELRQYRKLPEDEQQALIEVAKEGDKDSLMELAEELIAKQVKEKEALRTDLEITRQSLSEKKTQLTHAQDTCDELNSKLQRRVLHETPDEKAKSLMGEINLFHHAALAEIKSIENGFTQLTALTEDSGTDHRPVMAGIVDSLMQELVMLRANFYLPEYEATTHQPEWTQDSFNEALPE